MKYKRAWQAFNEHGQRYGLKHGQNLTIRNKEIKIRRQVFPYLRGSRPKQEKEREKRVLRENTKFREKEEEKEEGGRRCKKIEALTLISKLIALHFLHCQVSVALTRLLILT